MASATITTPQGTTITIDDSSFDRQIAEGAIIATVTVSDAGGLLGFGLTPPGLDGNGASDAFGWILNGQRGEAFEMMNFEDSDPIVTSFTFQIVALKDIDFGSLANYDFRFDTWYDGDQYEEGIVLPLTIEQGPTAVADAAETVKDLSKTIDVIANDTDSDGTLDPTTVTIVDQPLHGTVTVNATTGVVTYKPAAGYVGADTFTYTVKDNDGNVSTPATVTLDVTGAHILTSGNDVFSGDSLGLTTSGIEVHGGAGDDYIVTSNRAAMPDKIDGGDGNDLIFTGSGDDYVDGGAGDDVIHARAGNDTVIGGTGDDTFVIRFTDAGTTTIIDDDGTLWHGTFRPASIPSTWTPAPSPTSGFAIEGTATVTGPDKWNLTVTDNLNVIHNLTLTLVNGDLTIVEAGKPQTIVIKDYASGTFGITLGTDADQAPQSVTLSNNSISEDAQIGDVVGTVSAVDPEGHALTIQLTGGASEFFEIVDGEIRLKKALDYETAATHQIEVTVTDAVGNKTIKQFDIAVGDVYEGPSKGMITIDVSGAGSAGVDVEAFLRGGFISDTVGGGFPSFDNSSAFAGEEMFIGYGADAISKYVLAHGELSYNFGTHTIAGEINTIEFGTRGNGVFDSNGYFTGGNAAMKITGLNFANAVPTNSGEEAEIEANGLVHLFGIAHMYGQSTDPTTAARVAAALNKIANGLDDYAQHFIGSAGADAYIGTRYADEIEGGAGNDILSGGGGDDSISGGAGNNIIAGGAGDDTVVFDGLKSAYTITTGSNGSVSVLDKAAGTTDTLSGVEFLRFQDKIIDLSDGSEEPAGSPPQNIGLSKTSVAENSAAGTVVGTLSAVDPDGGTVSFALASASDKFSIVGNQLRVKGGLDYETAKSHQVVVKVTDSFGSVANKTFTIGVTNVNEAPTGLALKGNTVAENAAVGTTVGTLSAVDPEGGAVSYSLSGSSAKYFKVVGNKLQVAKGLDYETLKSHALSIVAKDASGNSLTKAFTVKVGNVDEAPTSIALSKTTVVENSKVGTTVGTLSAIDPEGGAVTFSLASNPGGNFKLVGNKLQVAKSLDYEDDQSHTIKVKAIDVSGKVTQKTLTIEVTDKMETINGTSKSETINGKIGADKIFGLNGNDKLNGGLGNDYLSGGAGSDTLYGGRGADDLYGGAGKDTFVFKAVSDSTVSSSGRDTIFDFSGKGGDIINLSAIDAVSGKSGNQAFSFIGEDAFSGKAGQLRYVEKASDTYIYADINGDKKADFAIHLDDALSLNKGYFIL